MSKSLTKHAIFFSNDSSDEIYLLTSRKIHLTGILQLSGNIINFECFYVIKSGLIRESFSCKIVPILYFCTTLICKKRCLLNYSIMDGNINNITILSKIHAISSLTRATHPYNCFHKESLYMFNGYGA